MKIKMITKLLIIFLTALVIFSVSTEAKANFCVVRNEKDYVSSIDDVPNADQIADDEDPTQDNHWAIRWQIEEALNEHGQGPGLSPTGGLCKPTENATGGKFDWALKFNQSIRFQTFEWGKLFDTWIDIEKIKLYRPIPINFKNGPIVIGNPPQHEVNSNFAYDYAAKAPGLFYYVAAKDYGYVVIDARTHFNDKEHPFDCAQGNSDVVLRKLIINTRNINYNDFFDRSKTGRACLFDGGDFYVCPGILHLDQHPVGEAGWCTAAVEDAGETDGDGDGFCEDANNDDKCDDNSKPGDCNDDDKNINPDQVEICGDGKDNDCNGTVDDAALCPEGNNPDKDNDGYCAENVAICPSGKNTGDCNDNDKLVHPGALEIPGDGKDQDCDNVDGSCVLNVTPESATIWAGDDKEYSVSYGTMGGYKGDATIYVNGLHSSMTAEDTIVLNPGETKKIKVKTAANTPEASYPLNFSTKKVASSSSSRVGGIGSIDKDKAVGSKLIGDITPFKMAYKAGSPGADSFNSIYDFAPRNQIIVNFGLLFTAECSDQVTLVVKEKGDADSDGDGDPDDTDCNPNDPAIHHGAAENCGDGVDNDCDGKIDSDDSACSNDGETDNDGDGYCEDTNNNGQCEGGSTDPDVDNDGTPDSQEGDTGPKVLPGDCDDTNAAINPAAAEACDGKDNNCDGTIDNVDQDKDGYSACDTNGGGTTGGDVDCNDNNANVHPGATELCSDNTDNNCNGNTDEGCSGLPTEDDDGDGYCESTQCSDGSQPGDCDDTDASVNPGAAEICGDNKDNDCDGKSDAFDPLCAVAPAPPGSIGWAANLEGGSCSLNTTDGQHSGMALMFGLAAVMMSSVLMLRRVKK